MFPIEVDLVSKWTVLLLTIWSCYILSNEIDNSGYVCYIESILVETNATTKYKWHGGLFSDELTDAANCFWAFEETFPNSG